MECVKMTQNVISRGSLKSYQAYDSKLGKLPLIITFCPYGVVDLQIGVIGTSEQSVAFLLERSHHLTNIKIFHSKYTSIPYLFITVYF